MKNVGKLRPRHLICAVALTIDRQLCTPDRYRPRITGWKAYREVPEGLVGKGGAGDLPKCLTNVAKVSMLQAEEELLFSTRGSI